MSLKDEALPVHGNQKFYLNSCTVADTLPLQSQYLVPYMDLWLILADPMMTYSSSTIMPFGCA
jgi:hypothetical protein